MYSKAYHINNINTTTTYKNTMLVYSTYTAFMALHKKYTRSRYLVYPSAENGASTLFLYMETEDLFAGTRPRRFHSNTYTFFYTHQYLCRAG